MDKLCDIECFTQRRRRIPPQKNTNAHIHYCDRHLEEAEVLAWTPNKYQSIKR